MLLLLMPLLLPLLLLLLLLLLMLMLILLLLMMILLLFLDILLSSLMKLTSDQYKLTFYLASSKKHNKNASETPLTPKNSTLWKSLSCQLHYRPNSSRSISTGRVFVSWRGVATPLKSCTQSRCRRITSTPRWWPRSSCIKKCLLGNKNLYYYWFCFLWSWIYSILSELLEDLQHARI